MDIDSRGKRGRKITGHCGPIFEKGYFATIFSNITIRKKSEEEQQKIHRLESIGVLSGGIAYDINKILAGILYRF